MFKRNATKILLELAKSYPVVAVTGPRQSGKTTLTKNLFKSKKYVSLEDLDQLAFAKEDPRGFLSQSQSKSGLIIDEIQNCPELFSYLQGVVDNNQVAGEFIITGSQQFRLVSGITQSLAGRVGLVELLPFAISEIQDELGDIDDVLYKGFYPPIYDKKIEPRLWYEDYVRTYIEKDVRNLVNIKDLSLFQKFLGLCAARSGQCLNYSELSNASGVEDRTIKSWLSVLEASYIINLLKPHHNNFSKKLVKTPKLYFLDPGLLCYLLRIRREDVPLSPHKGHIFESMIISEYLKQIKNYRLGIDLHFWRDNKGIEIDLLFELNQKIHSIEIKSGKTIQSNYFKNLKTFQKYSGSAHGQSYLIYGGDDAISRNDTNVLPWFKAPEPLV